ncbi:GHMP kinase [Formosa agariphila KMM 3901]|uniref:GHMP kinase n=1 Tax=Formosa agariphila (strain DSM 15362 / KCTC 12365 / LMG 23005 / KMM 3901 / M-2Alg 35-1) TaxID=1347342 RepID=T2KPL1_FORAG|nr:GYDIA family GHMP kinase [Formosa agariphila]CDF80685.1 GHMP kinase [Formosa agariphila KMM 3901]
METFYSNGKLLITAEYLVLDGAEALALPTKFGQSLSVKAEDRPGIRWQSFNDKAELWLDVHLDYNNALLHSKNDDELITRLASILNAAKSLNPDFLKDNTGYSVQTHLDFPNNWGLGTSSTLINNVANWAKVNPYKLLALTFGGSGYDIACASNNTPITYQLSTALPIVKPVFFQPNFSKHIYFVHLNEKQNSREGISHYKSNTADKSETIQALNVITSKLIACTELKAFQTLIEAHEHIISERIKLAPVKTSRFPDFTGSIKSLGAWGGDFVMAVSENDPTDYFKNKGYHTILKYQDMIL